MTDADEKRDEVPGTDAALLFTQDHKRPVAKVDHPMSDREGGQGLGGRDLEHHVRIPVLGEQHLLGDIGVGGGREGLWRTHGRQGRSGR